MNKKNYANSRYQTSYETKDSGASKGVFDFKEYGEVTFFKPEEGRNKIIIVPYEIKTKNHPLVAQKRSEIGFEDYVMDIWVHRGIGASSSDYVCLKKNYNKPCPICEMANDFQEQGKENEYKNLKPSRRVYYNVVDGNDIEAGMQIFNVSHFLFEKEVIEEARSESGSDESVDFGNFMGLKTVISFRTRQKKFDGNKYFEYRSIRFDELDEEDAEEIEVKDAISFDEIMTVYSYDELKDILYGNDIDEDNGKSTENETDAEEKEKPRSRKRSRRKEKPNRKSKDVKECPHGHTFEKDCDEYKECDKCKEYKYCLGE